MVLNELSLKTPAKDIPTARKLMSNLIKTLSQATISGVKKVLRTKDDMGSILIAPNYPISRWRNDPEVEREEKSFFRSLTTKTPFWTDIITDIKDEFDLSEFLYQEETPIGLGFAFLIDGIAVSIFSEQQWDNSILELIFRHIDDNDNLIDENIKIIHASRIAHIQEHAEWIKKRLKQQVNNGFDLWERKGDLFPHLEFCDSVEKQLQNMDVNNPMFRQILKRLFELEEVSKNWTEGALNLANFPSKVTQESDSRLQQLTQKLTFTCPDGIRHSAG